MLRIFSALLLFLTCAATRLSYAESPGAADREAANESFTKEDFGRAIELYSKAIAAGGWTNEDLWWMHRLRGESYYQLGNFKKAIVDIDESIRLNPRDVESLINRGELYNRFEQHEEAIAVLDRALAIDRRLPLAYSNRAGAEWKLGQTNNAINDVSEAIRLVPNEAAFYFLRGQIFSDDHQYEKGLADFSKVIKLEPDSSDAYMNRAVNYVDLNDYSKALADFDQAVKLTPDSAMLLANRGGTYVMVGEYGKGLADLQKAESISPDNPQVINNLAWLLATCPDDSIRNGKRAVELAKKADELSRGAHWPTVGTLAAAYAESGDFEQALVAQKRAVDLASKSQPVDENEVNDLKARLKLFEEKKPYRDEPEKSE